MRRKKRASKTARRGSSKALREPRLAREPCDAPHATPPPAAVRSGCVRYCCSDFEVLWPRQRSEQYLTSFQTRAHFLRHANGLPQEAHVLLGRVDLVARLAGFWVTSRTLSDWRCLLVRAHASLLQAFCVPQSSESGSYGSHVCLE